ncbi:hypothetical protein [Pseudomonas pharyngis]|uniref:hypothetical protein n=1 Tax=Pseudomonas pharyngis TaxID=2892333 RepID=UPI001F33BF03|nr:hypothetical protein [Pseudomonas pharyngis]
MRRASIYFAAALFIFSADQVFALIGNSLLGKNNCLVACGRGPMGVAPLGDIMKGVNEFAFGPTLDAFEQKGKNIIDYASEKAGIERVALGKTLEDKIQIISEIAQDSVSQLDSVLRNNVNLGIEGLSRSIESLDIVGSKQNDQLNSLFRGVVYLVSVAAFIIWLAKYIATKNGPMKSRLYQARWRFFVSGVALTIIIAAPFFIPQLKYRIPEIEKSLLTDYSAEFKNLSFQRSAYIAGKLAIIDPKNQEYLRMRDVSTVLRDVFFNPASYRTTEGLSSTQLKVASLLLSNKTHETIEDKPQKFVNDSSLEIALAMIVWQVRQDDIAHFQAANICAHIIQRELSKPINDRVPLLPLAGHYLDAYLVNPIGDIDFERIKDIRASDSPITPDIYETNYPLIKIEELREISKLYNQKKSDSSSTQKNEALSEQLNFGKKISETYSVVIPGYIEMLNLNFMMRSASGEALQKLTIQRKMAAEKIINSWNETLANPTGSYLSSNTNLRLSLLTALSTTHQRAQAYGESTEASVPSALNETTIDSLPDEKIFYKKWISTMKGAVRPSGIPLLSLRSKAQFMLDQDLLIAFEKSYMDFLSEPTNIEKAGAAASNASRLGLFVCTDQNSSEPEERYKTVDCSVPNARSLRAVWYIRSIIPVEKRTIADSWTKSLKQSFMRPPPII